MNKKNKINYVLEVLGFVTGIALGFLLPQFAGVYTSLGSVYVNCLKLLSIPVLMCTVFGSLSNARRKQGILARTVVLFIIMFAVSFLLTALLCSVLKPGRDAVAGEIVWQGEGTVFSLSTFLSKVFPANIFAAMAAGDILPCILFSSVLGIVAGRCGAENLTALVSELETVLMRMLKLVLKITPAGVCCLMAAAVAGGGGEAVRSGLKYILCAYAGCLLVFALVMAAPVCFIEKIGPWKYFSKIRRVLLMSVSTCSSAATLPETIRTCREEFGVPEEIYGLCTPLGCTIHMCGGAVSFCLLAFFTFQMSGMTVKPSLFLLMLLLAEFINMAAPGIPGGGIVLGASFLGSIGAPLTFMGLYSAIYRFLDMAYTSMNVLGDVTANVILNVIYKKKETSC